MTDQNEEKTVVFQQNLAATAGASGIGQKAADVPRARLRCVDASQVDGQPGDLVVPLEDGREQILGRGEGSTVIVPSRKLSRQHARIFPGVGTWGIEDLNSTNGIHVNGQKISTAWLKHGDEVRLGPVVFRYELEQPPADAVAATSAGAGADDDASERTMMVGSLSASNAVLEAVRKVEIAVEEAESESDAGRSRTQRPAKSGGRRFGLILMALVVLGGLVAGGIYYYPTYQKQQALQSTIAAGEKAIQDVIVRARQVSNPFAQTATIEQELTDLAPAVAAAGRYLAVEPDNTGLAVLHARGTFLLFEREFLLAMSAGDVARARQLVEQVRQDLAGTAGRLPATALPAEVDGIQTIRELSDFAALLVDFHAFALRYPQVSRLATETPTLAEITALEDRKQDFTRFRRSYNAQLSVDYVYLNHIVKVVEDRDLALLSQWKDFVTSASD